jgi:beta-arrestin
LFTPTSQEVLMKKLGEEAIPFFFEISDLSPPSVHLNPAKQYEGSPIGISYDVRIFMGERPSFVRARLFRIVSAKR